MTCSSVGGGLRLPFVASSPICPRVPSTTQTVENILLQLDEEERGSMWAPRYLFWWWVDMRPGSDVFSFPCVFYSSQRDVCICDVSFGDHGGNAACTVLHAEVHHWPWVQPFNRMITDVSLKRSHNDSQAVFVHQWGRSCEIQSSVCRGSHAIVTSSSLLFICTNRWNQEDAHREKSLYQVHLNKKACSTFPFVMLRTVWFHFYFFTLIIMHMYTFQPEIHFISLIFNKSQINHSNLGLNLFFFFPLCIFNVFFK